VFGRNELDTQSQPEQLIISVPSGDDGVNVGCSEITLAIRAVKLVMNKIL
jgi:hypothetical protein